MACWLLPLSPADSPYAARRSPFRKHETTRGHHAQEDCTRRCFGRVSSRRRREHREGESTADPGHAAGSEGVLHPSSYGVLSPNHSVRSRAPKRRSNAVSSASTRSLRKNGDVASTSLGQHSSSEFRAL